MDAYQERLASLDKDKLYTDVSNLEIGDMVNLHRHPQKGGGQGFVKSIGPKNIVLEMPYGGYGGADYIEIMEIKRGKDEVKEFLKPKKEGSMTKEDILKLDSKKHVKIWLLNKLGLSRKDIATALGTNPGHVGNEIKSYEKNPDKKKAAEDLMGDAPPPKIDVEYERQRLISAGMPDVARERYPVEKSTVVKSETKSGEPKKYVYDVLMTDSNGKEQVSKTFNTHAEAENYIKNDARQSDWYYFSVRTREVKEEPKKEAQSFGERMKAAREKKAAEKATMSPEDLEYDKLMRILKQTNSISAKELFAEFGVRDEQQMYGDAKRGTIFHKEYSQLSENKYIVNGLKVLHVFSKVWPIKTTITQKMVSSEGQHRYENGEDTESEYSVSRTSDVDIKIFNKKSGELIGNLDRSTIRLANSNKELAEAINSIKVYFNDGSTPFKQNVNFSKIISDMNKKSEEKKIADKWKTEKVPAGKKIQAKQDFEIWRKKTLKDVFGWLKVVMSYKRGHPSFEKAEMDSLILKEYVNKLINYPIFYAMDMGYEVEKQHYKDSASITWQLTANKYATKDKFNYEWEAYRQEYKYSADVNSWVARKFAEEINPILGTKYSSSGYSYDSSKIGFSVYKHKSGDGSKIQLSKGGVLVGAKHGSGGIDVKTPTGKIEVEGGEVIVNAVAAKENCEELSKINQSAGGGVAFPCDHSALDGVQGPMNGKGAKVGSKFKREFKIYKEGRTDGKINILSKPSEPFNRDSKIKKYHDLGYTVYDLQDREIPKASYGTKIGEGIDVEKEHTDLYNELSSRLEAEGHKMPMSQHEFFKMISAAHIKERGDYYPLLKKYVEHAPSLMDKPYFLLTKEEVISCRDFIEMREAAGIPPTAKCAQRIKDLARYAMVNFKTLLKDLK